MLNLLSLRNGLLRLRFGRELSVYFTHLWRPLPPGPWLVLQAWLREARQPVHRVPRLQTQSLRELVMCHFPWEMLWETLQAPFLVLQRA